MDDDALWDMSDEELESAVKATRAEEKSPETDIENEAEVLPDTEFDSPGDDEVDGDEEISTGTDEEEEEEDGSEQPKELIEGSDHDSSDKSKEDEVDKDNTEEADKADPDKDAELAGEESQDATDANKDEKQPTQMHSFKANGKDYEFSSDEIVNEFPKMFGKAMDYTKKMQFIKPWRKTIDALEGSKISHDDVSLMIDVLGGNKEAMNEVLKRTGVDTLELNTEDASNYEAKDYGRSETALEISDIVESISGDAEYTKTNNILSSQWDAKSWEAITAKPEIIGQLHLDVKSGTYDIIQPIAEKLKVFGGASKSDLEYYLEAAGKNPNKVNVPQTPQKQKPVEKQAPVIEDVVDKVEEAKAAAAKRAKASKASASRKAAATAKSAKSDKSPNYWDDSDEAYDSWYKKTMDV